MSSVNKKIISISIVALLVIISIGVSFAYFTANLTGGESASTIVTKAGTLDIAFAGGDNVILNNIYPQADACGTKTFTVKGDNTTNLSMPYTLAFVVDANTFTTGALQYGLVSVNTNNNGAVVPSTPSNVAIATGTSSTILGSGYFANATAAFHTYQLSIYFPDTGIPQNENQTQNFAAHVTITASQASTTTTT